jgi:nucleotide-binding universal stress UspA family protein
VNQVHAASAYLEEVVRDTLAGVNLPIATHVRSGDVVEAILDEVDESASNVIVMTTRGHGGVVRAVLGSVASELLGKSPVPVLLVRAGARPIAQQVRQILVPVDGSAESEQSLATAAELAGAAGASLTLLNVVTASPVPAWSYDTGAPVEAREYADPVLLDRAALADARQYVSMLAKQLENQHSPVRTLAVVGDVATTIKRTADEIAADLIVMRTRGRTGAARAVLGSVADAVVRSAAAPVLLLRGDGVEQAAAARHHRARVVESVW